MKFTFAWDRGVGFCSGRIHGKKNCPKGSLRYFLGILRIK